MKTFKYKKSLIIVLHLLFWFVSINAWTMVFNPGVDTDNFKELPDFWQYMLLANGLFYLYFMMPFIWLSKRTWKWVKIVVTILFLVLACYVVIQLLQPPQSRADISFFTDFFIPSFSYIVIFHLTIVASVYFNWKVLIPRYLSQNRFGKYILSLAALIWTSAVINFALFEFGIDKIFPSLYFISYYNIWELVLIIKLYVLFTMAIFLGWQYIGMLIANREKAQKELSTLKAQINPHFLFNNLNTIYSLASNNDARTKDVILQLSDFLRYVLYDTSNATIPLEKEVGIISKYVDLQKERVNPSLTQIILTIEGNFENLMIAPLLLLPLAENCFKHGIGNKPGKIQIYIGVNGKQLIFTTENSIALREKNGEDVSGGIGIKNVEDRLNLLYPNRHTLHFNEADGIFNVEMKIELLKM
jgi:hypothetical protein